jgi:hypothetical protein
MDFYNVMRDPGEKYGELYPGLFAVTPIQITLRQHMKMIETFPHRVSEVPPPCHPISPQPMSSANVDDVRALSEFLLERGKSCVDLTVLLDPFLTILLGGSDERGVRLSRRGRFHAYHQSQCRKAQL